MHAATPLVHPGARHRASHLADQLACEASASVGSLVAVHKWFTRRALLLHLTVLVVVPTFLGLGWWQYHAALGGNELSWAYTFEWPFFAGYAVFVWWKMLHDQPGQIAAKVRSARFATTPVGWAMTKHAKPPRVDDVATGPAGHPKPTAPHDHIAPHDYEELVRRFRAALDADSAALLEPLSPTVAEATDSPEATDSLASTASAASTATFSAVSTPSDATRAPRRDTAVAGAGAGSESPLPIATSGKRAGSEPGDGYDDDDPELAEYNRYLAALAASGRRKHW